MATNNHYTRLGGDSATFDKMIKRFGVVTVMDADVYECPVFDGTKTPYEIVAGLSNPLCHLDSLKVANVTQEGPTKTITGGKYANSLLKYGKTARLEMQDALGNIDAIDALCGGVKEWDESGTGTVVKSNIGLHFGADFSGPKTIVGDTFFIDQKTGEQVNVKIVFYQFLPDSIFNLTQDSEGDATVFDMNGDLLTTDVLLGTDGTNGIKHGVFYSIIDPEIEA